MGAEWLCFGDLLAAELQHSQNYVLMPYLTYPSVALHLLCASPQRLRPAFPTAETEVRLVAIGY